MILPNCYRCGKQPCECRDNCTVLTGDCIEIMSAMDAEVADLVFGSPPYCDARTYGIASQRTCEAWVEWMLDVTEAAARTCRGPVIWVAAGVTRKRNYWPACEGLMWEWWKRGGANQLYRPCVFHRVGIPGSGGKDWFRADWEYILCFKRPGPLPWSDNTACGHPPKWAPGGEMSHRLSDGTRVNQWGKCGDDTASGVKVSESGHVTSKGTRPSHLKLTNRDKWGATNSNTGCNGRRANGQYRQNERRIDKTHTKSKADGTMETQGYTVPVLANPGNVFHLKVGGGLMGDKLAHENEAPFPEKLAEIFVRSCCPEGGLVVDPFSGSGTTAAVAKKFGRRSSPSTYGSPGARSPRTACGRR